MSLSIKALALFVAGTLAQRQRLLAPASDINSPAGANAKEPLKWVGANGPWLPGDNVNGISPEVPEGCVVDQAAYVSRHGSRYPDNGAYNGWVSAVERFSAGGYTASGALSFLPSWKPVLETKNLQVAMENPTGTKEAFDYGYTLRTRYPDFYKTGDEFMVWANNYTRVLQTAEKFVGGYLGAFARTNGSIISVTGKGFPQAIGDTLAPSDMCPTFKDSEGSDQVAAWDAIWIPPVLERLQAMITGNLTLTADDISQGPYLCGFESTITGRLSPWCDIFTDEEFRAYEYRNDLRYYYGIGPGAPVNKKMMTPYLQALINLFKQGPGIEGLREDGVSTFTLPPLVVSFLNDGQLTELVTSSGVFDAQGPLDPESKDDGRLWNGNRYVTMRGTIAFERLSCKSRHTGSATRMRRTAAKKRSCHGGPPHGPGNGTLPIPPSATSSSVSVSATASASITSSASSSVPTPTPTDPPTNPGEDAVYIRVLLNDAVYPIPSCQNGPGRSCLLDEYVEYIERKVADEGDWLETCNVTDPAAPTKVKGASFYTDLSSPWLKRVSV
ncbi:histidine acid phosphatase [Microdochium trichocladiopsis]|uniref:3-phytase n=1 Tax=Microdochium trichocladiopsis TaxID=1682393 RepID=A0A9P8XRS3_9PEZI|nr:histidine acid phosphatase [Microdochium trichocladiopsis]KAH7014213.1 histidine acid phosphatase [Microdochium trichocladiopsis]